MQDSDVKEAIISLTVAQRQTTKNIDKLDSKFDAMIQNQSKLAGINEKLSSAHRRIDDTNKDVEKLEVVIKDHNKLLMGTLISAVFSLIGVVFLLMKGG